LTAVIETLVGRQPIFDRDLAVKGYELLFRSVDPPSVALDGPFGGHPTPEDLLGTAEGGIGALVGTKKAFCNASPGIVSGETQIRVPPDQVVVEIRQPIVSDGSALAGCRRLLDSGYSLALDDFQWTDGVDDLLALASTVKIDVEAVAPDRLPELVERCRACHVEVIAQKVDTFEELGRCASLGFDYFQGYVLSRPHVSPGRPLPPGRLAGLRMSARLLDAECPVSEIEEIVRSDPAMTHQLLQLAGIGAPGGMKRTVSTVRQALVLVGWRRLQSWVALLLLTDDGSASEEGIAAVLMRARMSELLAPSAGCQADAGYTAGLLSTLDVVLGMPIVKILDALPLDADIRDGILNGDGPLGRLVADVTDYQLGRPERASRCAMPEDAVRTAAVEALTWTVGMTSALESAQAFD